MNAEAWLVREKDLIESATRTGERWKPPSERVQEKKAEVLLFGTYGKKVIDQRKLSPRTRIEYEAKWSQLIEPTFGKVAVADMTPTAVRGWFSGLDATKERRNSHAYGVLNMICNTAVKDGLLDRNPCMIQGAMNTKAKENVKIPTTADLHAIADKLGASETQARFKALVLLAAWCGLRYGEVSELRRKDITDDCSVVSITRAVGHRGGECLLGPTKTGERRIVTIPPHIRQDIKDHLAAYVGKDSDALLFTPSRGGCHLNGRVFNKDVFQKAAKAVGREDLSAHDLRRFAGSKNAQVATLTENMARLGHKTVKASLLYQHSQSGRDAEIAADLSAQALNLDPWTEVIDASSGAVVCSAGA
ncbi:tyrosine-type recombinase/integrase [Mycolicibacterium sp.]|uniref:tyrosine-type recombinase/integrase n=1 Tax=Mycolicibacterium sp. TaxID=2320850 RepID=UPI003D12F4BB